MFHELLAALAGFPGNIFCLNAENNIQMVDDLPFCHPGERDVFIRICRLATFHFRLTEFIRHNGDIVTTTMENSSSYQGGIYLRSLCNALDEVFVTPYLRHLVELEREILGDRFLTVSHLQWSLEKYQSILPALVRLTDEVTSKRAHGCQILELIHSHAASGLPNVAVVLKKIQRICHATLIRNLTDWLLYGVLHDPFHEFFILQRCVTSDAIEGESKVESSYVDGHLRRGHMLPNHRLHSPVFFRLNGDLLPSYISADVAKTILFVGESIHMLEQNNRLQASRKTDGIDSIAILRDKRETFAQNLHDWQLNEDMQIAKFDLIVDNIRSCVAQHLWTLVVEKANLTGHLGSLKDFFLLGRGDLYTAFVEQADALLGLPPTANTKHMVNNAFQLVGRSLLPEDDDYFGNFKLIVSDDDDTKDRSSEGGALSSSSSCATGWSRLRLEYSAPFPIHTVFASESLNDLNELFQFLLKVKRVQLALHRCWALRIHARHRRLDAGDAMKWHLRTCMAFLVDNLQFYLQVDVLGSQYDMLMVKIKETRDFQQVQLAFHVFVTNIRTQAFLLMETLFKILNEFLDLCASFCSALDREQRSSVAADNCSPSDDTDDKLRRVYGTQFWRYANLLVKLLSGIGAHQAGPHVTQLLNTIDINQYFSKEH